MTLRKFKDLIRARNQKIKEMQRNFEPSQRIDAYKEASKAVIIEDYVKALDAAIAGNKARLDTIADEYTKRQRSLSERASIAALTGIELRSLTTDQLKRRADQWRGLPVEASDPLEMRLIAAELRGRGKEGKEAADDFALYLETIKADTPFVWFADYQDTQKRIDRLSVFKIQANEGTIITSDDVDTIDKADVISDFDKVI